MLDNNLLVPAKALNRSKVPSWMFTAPKALAHCPAFMASSRMVQLIIVLQGENSSQ